MHRWAEHLPAVVVPGGPMLTGTFRGQPLGCGTDVWRLSEEVRAGTLSVEQFTRSESAMIRSRGHCNTMGTASTMALVAEALGTVVPGVAGTPAADSRLLAAAHGTGRLIVEMVAADRRPPRLVTASERDETIAELLAGHAEDGTAPAWPGHLDERLRLTRAFRDELRELSARLVEHGVRPDGLVRLAHRHGRPEWEAAAHVLTEVDQVAGLRGDEAHDPAGIVAVAADLLADRLPQVRYTLPEATYLAWLDCRALGLPGSAGDFFLERAGVALVDGPECGAPGEGHVRLNFATGRGLLTTMVDRMAAAARGL